MIDYCTGWFEGWWSDCCQAHDADYLAQIGRLLADERLYQCVAGSLGDNSPMLATASIAVAAVMYLGVRLFGRYFYSRK